MDNAHKIVELTDIVLEEVRKVSCCDIFWVGYDNELAVSEATQAVGLQVLLGPKDTPSTLDDLLQRQRKRYKKGEYPIYSLINKKICMIIPSILL